MKNHQSPNCKTPTIFLQWFNLQYSVRFFYLIRLYIFLNPRNFISCNIFRMYCFKCDYHVTSTWLTVCSKLKKKVINITFFWVNSIITKTLIFYGISGNKIIQKMILAWYTSFFPAHRFKCFGKSFSVFLQLI